MDEVESTLDMGKQLTHCRIFGGWTTPKTLCQFTTSDNPRVSTCLVKNGSGTFTFSWSGVVYWIDERKLLKDMTETWQPLWRTHHASNVIKYYFSKRIAKRKLTLALCHVKTHQSDMAINPLLVQHLREACNFPRARRSLPRKQNW